MNPCEVADMIKLPFEQSVAHNCLAAQAALLTKLLPGIVAHSVACQVA